MPLPQVADAPRDRPFLGAAILFGGILAVAMMDVVGKLLSANMTVAQVSWARFFFHFVLLSPFALASPAVRGRAAFAKEPWRWHFLRGALIAGSSFAFFGALQKNPVPDALAVFFVEPIIVAFLARWFLGEKPRGRVYAAGAAGLAGVLVILRPGGGAGYDWTILLALLAAVCFAGYIVLSRAAASASSLATSWYTAFFAMLLSAPFAFYFWAPPTPGLWADMAFLGLLAAAGHTLIILSCRFAPAAQMAVLHYAEVPVAVVLSWFVFAHFPSPWVWGGVALIFAAKLLAISAPAKRG